MIKTIETRWNEYKKNICISSTFLCPCPLNLSFKLNFNISKNVYLSIGSNLKVTLVPCAILEGLISNNKVGVKKG